jgi:hypothetical protein
MPGHLQVKCKSAKIWHHSSALEEQVDLVVLSAQLVKLRLIKTSHLSLESQLVQLGEHLLLHLLQHLKQHPPLFNPELSPSLQLMIL